MNEDKVYEELALTWRHFALWREKSFAGYLTVLAALSVAFSTSPSTLVRVTIFLAGMLVSIAFWILDFRNGQLLNECQSAAAALETKEGAFTALNRARFGPSTWATYAIAIDLLVGGILGASAGGVYFYASRITKGALGCLAPLIVAICVPLFTFSFQRIRRKRWLADKERIHGASGTPGACQPREGASQETSSQT